VNFAAITLCVAYQRVFISISLSTQSGNFWIHPRIFFFFFDRECFKGLGSRCVLLESVEFKKSMIGIDFNFKIWNNYSGCKIYFDLFQLHANASF
jgi:hypothetical protein